MEHHGWHLLEGVEAATDVRNALVTQAGVGAAARRRPEPVTSNLSDDAAPAAAMTYSWSRASKGSHGDARTAPRQANLHQLKPPDLNQISLSTHRRDSRSDSCDLRSDVPAARCADSFWVCVALPPEVCPSKSRLCSV